MLTQHAHMTGDELLAYYAGGVCSWATGALLQKIGQWLDAGVAIVWVIDPVRHNAQCYAADGTIALVGEHDAIDGAPVLPGLRIPLASLWSDALG